MNEPTLLSPDRAHSLRRLFLALAILTGLAASVFVLASQPVTDFLREGPARLLPFEGGAARAVLGIGAAIATIVAGARSGEASRSPRSSSRRSPSASASC